MLPGDSREGLDASVLDGEQVRQFWDSEQLSGRWFARRDNLDLNPPLLWDAYLVFGPDAHWDRIPRPLKTWGSPVIANANGLKRALAPFLQG